MPYSKTSIKLKLCVSSIVLATLATTQSNAQQQSETDADVIRVWGTRVSSSSLYQGEEEISVKQADHLSDLLRTLPGVDIGGTHSVNTRINFRGLDDRSLSVYIDGALQTNYLYHHIGNLLINPDILKSADIQLGSNSVLHSGIGGAASFETKDAKDLLAFSDRDFGGRVSGVYNSNDMVGFSGTVYGQIAEQVDVLAYYNNNNRGNFKDGSGRETIGSDGTTEDIMFKLGFDLNEDHRLEASYDKLKDHGDYTQRPDMGVLTNESITGDILLPTEYERETVNFRYEGNFGEYLDLEATYYMNDMYLWRDESNPLIPRSHGSTKSAGSNNHGIYILANTRFGNDDFANDLKYGVDFFEQDLNYIANADTGSTAFEQNSKSLSFFAENEMTFFDRVILRPGLRYTDYDISYTATDSSGSWDKLNFALAGEIKVTEGLRLVASFTEIFRGPELAEVFTGSGATRVVNPDVVPEGGNNREVGFRYSGEVDGAVFNFGANYFKTRIDNFLGQTAAPSGPRDVWDANLGTAEFEGVEASASAIFGNFNALVTYSKSDLDASMLDTSGLTENIREIGDSVSVEAGYLFPELDLSINWNMLAILEKAVVGGAVKPSYTLHNISARWNDPFDVNGLTVTAGIDNLFNKSYTSHASRTGETFHPVFGALVLNDVEPGRNFKMTLSQQF